MLEKLVPIIVALISSGLTLIGVIIANRRSNTEMMAQIRQESEVSDVRIQGQIDVIRQEIVDLSKHVEKHNNMIDRTYKLETRMGIVETQIDSIKDDSK